VPALRVVATITAALLAGTACSSTGAPPSDAEDRVRPQAQSLTRNQCSGVDKLVRRVSRGYYPYRSPHISWIPHEPNYVGRAAMPVHSGPWDYLMRVPLLLYGPRHVRTLGKVDTPATVADMAATAAKLVRFGGWNRRDGKVLGEGLRKTRFRPRLVLQIVWDGVGWNMLNEHADKWPYLKRLMRRGVGYTKATVGSSPSVTPPIHANVGTGAFPNRHGISALRIRKQGAYEYVDPFAGLQTHNLELTTLADLYDRARSNRPVTGMLGSVSWHLGMIGHGSGLKGGDKDPVALLNRRNGEIRSNTDIYTLPHIGDPDAAFRYAEKLDRADGKRDGKWLGHRLNTHEDIHPTPATALFKQHLLERMVRNQGFGADRVPDLLYVNLKTADVAGHRWGLTSREVGEVIRYQDKALRRLVNFLDRRVGERRWVLMLTADHGFTPYPKESGAWPIYGAEISRDTNAQFDEKDNGVDLVAKSGSAGMYVNMDELKTNGITLRKIARWLADYTLGENVRKGDSVPDRYATRTDEPLFDAILVRRELVATSCVDPVS
jgi:hypothetical protein